MANTTDKSILTAAGKALLAQLNAEEKPLIIDKMIFANVPNRPEFPQPDDVVPTDNVVHQEAVEQRGRLSADSVIYSTTLTSNVGPFEFNWTGAYCSEYGVLVTIDHHALTPKSADEPGVAGNTLVRSVVLEYKDIAEITNITVDASSWQYNATPRMKKMDDDVAQAIIDQNGKDWFIEDGFLVTPQASAFNIKAGAGYVSGNRVTLEFDRNVQVPNKPSFIYVDAHREGTPTGEQVTLFDFVFTAEEKDDYTDGNGAKHFVCKIAQVLADGSVSDLRPEGESADKEWVNKEVTVSSESDTNTQQLVGTLVDFNLGTRQVDGQNAIRLTDLKLLMVFKRRTYPENEVVPDKFTIKSIVDNVMTVDYGEGEKKIILEYNVWPVGDLRRYGGYMDAILPNNADNPSPTDDTNAWLYALHCLPDPAEITVNGMSYATEEIPLSKSLHLKTPSLPTYYKRNRGINTSGWRAYGASGIVNTTTDTFDPKSKEVKQLAIILSAVTLIGGRNNTPFKTSDKSVELDYFHVEADGVTFANFYRNLDGSLGSWLWKLNNCSFTDAAEWGCWMDAAHGAHVIGCDFGWENLKGLYIDQGQSTVVTGNHFPHNAKYQQIAVQINRPQTMSFYDNYFETYSYDTDPRPLVNQGRGTYPLILTLDHYTNSDKGRFTPNYFGLHTKNAIIIKKAQDSFFSASEMNIFGNDIKNVGGFSDFYALRLILEGDGSSNTITMPFSGVEPELILDPNDQLRTFGNGAMWYGSKTFPTIGADKSIKIPADFPGARNDKNVTFVGDNQIKPITTKSGAKITLSYTWERPAGDANFIIRMKSFQGNYKTKDVYCTGKGGSGTLEVYIKKEVLEYTSIDIIVSGETNVGPSSTQLELRVESLDV